jgi:hypothetical protein
MDHDEELSTLWLEWPSAQSELEDDGKSVIAMARWRAALTA